MRRIMALLLLLMFGAAQAESALTVEGIEVSGSEARAFAACALEEYREAADYYAQNLGIDFWSLTYASGVTVEESIRADVFKQLVMLNLLYARALDEGLTLSEADEADCALQAEGMAEMLIYAGCAREDALALARKELLANRMYAYLLSGVEIDTAAVYESLMEKGSFSVELEYLFSEDRTLDIKACIPENNSLAEAAQNNNALSCGTVTVTLGSDDPLAQAVEMLLPGRLSDVIETDYGLFVLRINDSGAIDAAGEELNEALYSARVEAFSEEYERLYENAEYTIYESFREAFSLSGLK